MTEFEKDKPLTEEQLQDIINTIIKYTKLGYSMPEITIKLHDYTITQLSRIKREYEEEHGWFSARELKEFERLRREREAQEAFEKLSPENRRQYEQVVENRIRNRQLEFVEMLRKNNMLKQEKLPKGQEIKTSKRRKKDDEDLDM